MKPQRFVFHSLLSFGIGCLLLLVSGLSCSAATQATNAVLDPYPLRPPDTSSPRDTLRSFLTNVETAAEAWRSGTLDNASDHAWMSAIRALDFSTTPESDSWSVQTERSLLLKEILDRLELPPDSEIPGDEEVAKGSTARWTIPNTRISIVRIESGPRAGEFLFSATTVERLFRSYMLAKDLPYKPTASTPGIYEAYISSDRTQVALERELRLRLRRIDTSSPRSTVRSFLDSVDRAYALAMDADKALKARPPRMTRKEALEHERTANDLLLRAAATLDLSRIPEAHRKAAGIEIALKLKEVLDRTLLPALETIPDLGGVAAAREEGKQSPLRAAQPFRWRYPNTGIEIVEIMEGDRQGEFLFSAGTVSRLNDFYAQIRSIPYRTNLIRAQTSKYAWAEVSEGFYEFFITSPGYLVPRLSFLGGFVDSLPAWLKSVQGGQTVWQWIGLFLTVLVVVFAAGGVSRLVRFLAGHLNPPWDGWLGVLTPALMVLILIGMKSFVRANLNLSGDVRTTATALGKVAGLLLVIWIVTGLCKAIAETVIASPRIREGSLDASLLRITMRMAAFLIGGWIVVVAVRDLGADLVPLLAGLGVGGLAVALAAQRTLANFIGSLILFANKPVRPGDFCRYGDQIGTVEHIGLLSSRIRSLERSIITVPNAEFSEIKLENFAVRDQRLLKTVLQLRYETTPEQLRYVLARLREMLLGHPMVSPDPARVRFIGYGAYSKDLEIFAYLRCQDQNTFLAIQEDILLRIEDIVGEAGSGFAFPSQTTYFTRDTGVDKTRKVEAETRVERWRRSGKLPFPEFAGEQRRQLENILDYPPQGSPDYAPGKPIATQTTKAEPATFSMDDRFDFFAIAARLREANALADHLRNRLSEETQELLASDTGDRSPQLKEALVRDLNAIILGPTIFEATRFTRVQLRQQTRDLLSSNPEGDGLARLNRLLMEDAYPKELLETPK